MSTTWARLDGQGVILCSVTVPDQRGDGLMVTNVGFGVRPRFKYWLGNSDYMTLHECLVTQSCSTLGDAMDCSPLGSSVWDFPGKNIGVVEKEMATHPVFLPGTSHGCRSLAGYSPWGCKESDMTQVSFYNLYIDKTFSEYINVSNSRGCGK